MVKNPVSLNSKVTHKYDDIIHIDYPYEKDETKHPRMAIEERAKIFSPFAALKGHEEAITAKTKIVVPKIELSEEAKEYINLQLDKIKQLLSKGIHPIVTVVYFQMNFLIGEEEGEYIQFTGVVSKLDQTSGILQVVDKKLRLENIYRIESKELDGV